jgi:tetratricopeptide (TPR) repeat protein
MRRIFALLTTSFLFITAALSQEGLALAEKYNAAADSFANSSDYTKAILLRKKALNVYQNMRPVPYPQVVAEFRSLGIYFRRTGNNNEAAYNLKRAVELAEKKLDKNHIELAKAYNSLGVHALTKGSFEDALQLLSKSLDINERMQYPGVADNFNNLGIVYERLGNYKAAEEKYLQSLKYNLATLGFYKQNVADNYQNLGSASYQLGDFDRSLAYFDTPKNTPILQACTTISGPCIPRKATPTKPSNSSTSLWPSMTCSLSGTTPTLPTSTATLVSCSSNRATSTRLSPISSGLM